MKQRLKMMITLLSLSIGFVVFGASARAATFTVSNTGDSGAGSLRAAVASANASIDADTINFAIPAGDAGCTAGVCTITLDKHTAAI
jgi:hypothetical protein